MRGFLASLAAAALLGHPAQAQALKGVATHSVPGEQVPEVGAVWYHDLLPQWGVLPEDEQYVPTVWGRDVDDATFRTIRHGNYSAVLGFNEPDKPGWTELQVHDAVECWRKLVATGKRLGSPAVHSDYAFLDHFMAGTRREGLRVDFIAVHSYSSVSDPEAAAQSVAALVDWVHNRYGLPVWVTELGVYPDARPEQQQLTQRFIQAVVPLLEDRASFVERYAWASDLGSSGLWDDAGEVSSLGRAYKCPICESP